MRKFQKGFTLIELAVALVIIGILVSMAIGAYRGVKSTTVHVQWQVLMNEANDALVRFAADHGYLPLNQAEFDTMFNKRVDDFNYGGKIIYTAVDVVTDKAFIEGGRICSVTDAQVADVDGKQIVATLAEATSGRTGRLANKEIQLAELKSAIRCLSTVAPIGVANLSLPVYEVNKAYDVSLKSVGGSLPVGGRYFYCVQIKAEDNSKLKCRNDPDYIVKNDLFKEMIGNGLGSESVMVSSDCMAEGASWRATPNPKLFIVQKPNGEYEKLASGTLPITIFTRDHAENFASKELMLTIVGPELSAMTGCAGL